MSRNGHNRQSAEKAGRRAEWWAALYLRLKGYRILHKRLKSPLGEIDLVARRGKTLVFVEVKQRTSTSAALEAVRPQQQARITRTAQVYLSQQTEIEDFDVRFDLLALTNRAWPFQLWHITHVTNAWMTQ